MIINSDEFGLGEMIPKKYTADGENISPPLKISDIPKDAKTLILICDDPDASAGVWLHWLVFNIHTGGGNEIEIKESASPGTNGLNDFHRLGYGGPSPPQGTGKHRYFFRVFAIDALLHLQEGATRQQVKNSMQGHVLDSCKFYGFYSRD
jgi:hypothetical protein